MKTNTHVIARKGRIGNYAYGLTLFLLALTGFAQMPIFKRYYIADIPGLGWLAEFYTTHFLHYLGATAILAITTYFAAQYLLVTRRYRKLSGSGAARAAILLGIIVSGILLVIRNSAFVPFSPAVVTGILLVHLGLTMVFLLFALYCRFAGRPWTIPV
ncbi:MAG: FeS-binding protein [Desulfobacterales bacterium]|nr:FeS-binding protein [Desulfobacterales bacterium]